MEMEKGLLLVQELAKIRVFCLKIRTQGNGSMLSRNWASSCILFKLSLQTLAIDRSL